MNVAAGEASSRTLLVVILIGGSIFTFGYVAAVMSRARSDFITTKQSIKGLRKSYWQAVLTTIKAGLITAAVLTVLVIWVINDVRGR